MNDITKALKDFNESIKRLTEATERISSTQTVIDDSVKRTIEDEREKAQKVLRRIKF